MLNAILKHTLTKAEVAGSRSKSDQFIMNEKQPSETSSFISMRINTYK